MTMKEMNTIRYTMETVPQAAAAMEAGELVAVPTETVYGLAAHAGLDQSVQDIYTVKTRNPGKPLSILVSGMDMVEGYTQNIPAAAYRLAEKYWPGPLTMVLEDKGCAAPTVTAGGDTLGVRCPDHPMTLALIRALGAPLAAPSANPEGAPSPKSAQDIIERVRRFAKEDAKRAIVMVEHRLDLLSWIDRAVFLSQGQIKAETADSSQFLDPEWLAKNYFE